MRNEQTINEKAEGAEIRFVLRDIMSEPETNVDRYNSFCYPIAEMNHAFHMMDVARASGLEVIIITA